MIWIMAPFYNERDNLSRFIESWRKVFFAINKDFHFLLIDDSSTDGGADILSQYADVIVLKLMKNSGPGAAFQTGFNYLIERLRPEDIVFTCEADNTSDPRIAIDMIAKLNGGADLVLAACYSKDGAIEGTNIIRLILSFVANRLLKICFNLPHITTFTSFYRAYTPKILISLGGRKENLFRTKGFVCMAELLLKAANAGAIIEEVPMKLRCDLRRGASKMKIIKNIIEYAKMMIVNYREWIPRALGIKKKI